MIIAITTTVIVVRVIVITPFNALLARRYHQRYHRHHLRHHLRHHHRPHWFHITVSIVNIITVLIGLTSPTQVTAYIITVSISVVIAVATTAIIVRDITVILRLASRSTTSYITHPPPHRNHHHHTRHRPHWCHITVLIGVTSRKLSHHQDRYLIFFGSAHPPCLRNPN